MKKHLYIIIFLIALSTVFPQTPDVSQLPKLLGATNLGKEFWFTVPPCFEDESGGPEFIRVFVSSSIKTKVTIEIKGKGYFQEKYTVPNDVIMFNITPIQAQPYSKNGHEPNIPEQIFKESGIHVYSEQPVIVYAVARYHYTSDGWLCIPTRSAGREYIVSGYKVDSMFNAIWGYKLPSTCGVIAPFDSTKVKFKMGGNSSSKTAGGLKPGDSTEFVMNRGDVWMVSTNGDNADLSGSKITSDKPVQVITGEMCANIPTGNQWCDYCAEMDLPTYTWGTDLPVPQIINRKYPSLVRIYAKEAGTTIYRDGTKIGYLKTSGGIEGEAFLDTRLVPMTETPRSAIISGDKPITVTLLNTGTQEDLPSTISSDPFWMSITPIQQYQKEITFCTPGMRGSYGFPYNYLSLIYESDESGLAPLDLEFAIYTDGQYNFSPVKMKFPGIDERFVKTNGKQYAHKFISLPGDGVYKIRAKKPFAAYSYGFSDYDSYGYPASAAFFDLEHLKDTLPPVPTWVLRSNGIVDSAFVTDMPTDSTLCSNLAIIELDESQSYNYKLDFAPFIPGDSRSTTWNLTPVNIHADAHAVITFGDKNGNDTTIVIDYKTKSSIVINPSIMNFEKTREGDTTSMFMEISNNDISVPLVIMNIECKQNQNIFFPDLINYPVIINPKEKKKIKLNFFAAKVGDYHDTLILTLESSEKIEISLLKGSVGKPSIFQYSGGSFGSVKVNYGSATSTLYLQNYGDMDAKIFGYTISDNNAFEILNLPETDLNGYFSEPIIISPEQYIIVNLEFHPKIVKNYQDSVVFFTNGDPTNKVACELSGISISTDIKESKTDIGSLEIIPNPINSTLNYKLKLDEPCKVEFQIIDLLGNVVQNVEPVYYYGDEQDGNIKIKNLSSGIYFLKLTCNEIILSKKFTISK